MLVVVLVHMVVITDSGIIGSGDVYGRDILVDGGSRSGADGSGHVGCEVQVSTECSVLEEGEQTRWLNDK